LNVIVAPQPNLCLERSAEALFYKLDNTPNLVRKPKNEIGYSSTSDAPRAWCVWLSTNL